MKTFDIIDANNNQVVRTISAGNGKAALRQFRNLFTATGMYEIHKVLNIWTLSSSYGAYFVAKEAK